jgi:hypothetical protein
MSMSLLVDTRVCVCMYRANECLIQLQLIQIIIKELNYEQWICEVGKGEERNVSMEYG